MAFNAQVGETIHINDVNNGHLWVILSHSFSDDTLVIVNFTETDPYNEYLINILPNDFPGFIKKPTTINFGNAIPKVRHRLLSNINNTSNISATHHICPNKLIERIILSAYESNHMGIGLQLRLMDEYPKLKQLYDSYHV